MQEENEQNNIHNQPPSDDITRNKIRRHLSDKEDTISEEDINNINTDVNKGRQQNETKGQDSGDMPKKEMPNTWEILDETEE